MTTISSSTTIGITLTSPAYTNPIVVDPGVTITNSGNAVYAPSGYWAIQNGGTISTANGRGIYLFSGAITNAATGSIAGGLVGIKLAGNGGTVLNSGVIAGTGTAGVGVGLYGGGIVSNAASGSIRGTAIGVKLALTAGAATFANSASASGTGGMGVYYCASGQ